MAAVIAIVNYQDRVLIGKKKLDSPKVLRGEWHIPGEKIENSETDEEALLRGIKEEVGLEIRATFSFPQVPAKRIHYFSFHM